MKIHKVTIGITLCSYQAVSKLVLNEIRVRYNVGTKPSLASTELERVDECVFLALWALK